MSYFYWSMYAASLAGMFYAGYHYGSYLAHKASSIASAAKAEMKKF
jgi:hypothetical protein